MNLFTNKFSQMQQGHNSRCNWEQLKQQTNNPEEVPRKTWQCMYYVDNNALENM